MNRNGCSAKSGQKLPMYYNPAGPGDHNLPAYSACDNMSSSVNRTAPKFSMQTRNKIPFFPEFTIEFKGKDAPGMNTYNPNDTLIKSNNKEFYQPTSARFQGECKEQVNIKKNV